MFSLLGFSSLQGRWGSRPFGGGFESSATGKESSLFFGRSESGSGDWFRRHHLASIGLCFLFLYCVVGIKKDYGAAVIDDGSIPSLGVSPWLEIVGTGKVLVPRFWDFAMMGGLLEMALVPEGSLPLVAAIVDGGNRRIDGESMLTLSFKVLGRGGGASMVALFGVVFMVEGDMVVQQTKGDGSVACVQRLGLLQLSCLGLGFCYLLWAFLFYFNVLIDGGHATHSF